MQKEPDRRAADDIYDLCARADHEELGLRDRHRVAKLRRISEATCTLFAEHGYDGTTLREIARRADVALGTVALYADDKRDLIVMLFNQLIPQHMDVAAATFDADASLADNMVAYFSPFYVAYANDITLYRIILGQIFNRTTSVHARENARIRVRIIGHLTAIVDHARSRGEISDRVDPDLQARLFFATYFGAVRLWLALESPTPAGGIADLRAMFDLLVAGLAAAPVPHRQPADA